MSGKRKFATGGFVSGNDFAIPTGSPPYTVPREIWLKWCGNLDICKHLDSMRDESRRDWICLDCGKGHSRDSKNWKTVVIYCPQK